MKIYVVETRHPDYPDNRWWPQEMFEIDETMLDGHNESRRSAGYAARKWRRKDSRYEVRVVPYVRAEGFEP